MHKSGAIMAKRLEQWFDPWNDEHQKARLIKNMTGQWPDTKPGEVWSTSESEKLVEAKAVEVTLSDEVVKWIGEVNRLATILGRVSFPGYTFLLKFIGSKFAVQVKYDEPDVYSHEIESQLGREWVFPSGQTEGQVVQTCFKALLTSMEHRAREQFHWKGRPVFMPHMDLEQLWDMLPGGMHQHEVKFG